MNEHIKNLVTEIDKIRSRLNTNTNYDAQLKSASYAQRRDEAHLHSVQLEFPHLNDPLTADKLARPYLIKLNNAWNYLNERGLTLDSILTLGHLIEPEQNPDYLPGRNLGVKCGVLPAAWPGKIIERIKELATDLETYDGFDILRAIHAHVEIAGIHPFGDGNGRAARLLQNFCLQQRSIAAPIIEHSEKPEYIALIQNCLKERHDNNDRTTILYDPTIAETAFVSFISNRIIRSMKEIEEKLKQNRRYNVTIEADQTYDNTRLTKNVNCLSRILENSTNECIHVKKRRRKKPSENYTLEITGNLEPIILKKTLDSFREKYGINYTITL